MKGVGLQDRPGLLAFSIIIGCGGRAVINRISAS